MIPTPAGFIALWDLLPIPPGGTCDHEIPIPARVAARRDL